MVYTDGFILVFAESDGLPSVIDDDSRHTADS